MVKGSMSMINTVFRHQKPISRRRYLGAFSIMPIVILMLLAFPRTAVAAVKTVITNWTLTQDEVVDGMYLKDGTTDLNGHRLTVNGNLIQSSGTMYVHGGQLIVTGDYRIQTESGGTYGNSSGYLKMISTADYVLVGGAFFTQSSNNHNGYLTAGILEVRGNFSQLLHTYWYASPENFAATSTHKVILSGASLQTVYLSTAGSSKFNALEIRNGSIKFNSILAVNNIISNGFELPSITMGVLNWVLTEDEVINGDLYINGSTLDLSGKNLTVKGKLIQSAGTIDVNGGKLYIYGDYRIQSDNKDGTFGGSYGILRMTNPLDYIQVRGNFVTQAISSHNGLLTGGVLEVRGNFSQLLNSLWYASPENFLATDTHKVTLSGTNLQTVFLNNAGYSKFNTLEIQNSLIKFNSSLALNQIISNGYELPSITLGVMDWNLNEDETINGDLYIKGSTLNLSGKSLTVKGKVVQSNGLVHINGGKLFITGDYRMQTENVNGTYGDSFGQLRMTNTADYVQVGGGFVTQTSASHNGLLTAGVLEVRGNFTQLLNGWWYASPNNYLATGTHKTILSGTNLQTISFTNPGPSKFNILGITKPLATGYRFLCPTPVWNSLVIIGDIQPPTAPTNLSVAAKSLTTVSLIWSASSDDVGVTGYEIYRNDIEVDTCSNTSYLDTGLNPDSTYSYFVKAYDSADNKSSPSNTRQRHD